ncbi:MAG: hypothetical protein R3209_06305 [Salinimicrobium sediminis]|nr:hypothetical protein [Salinimicrobium sediminis]
MTFKLTPKEEYYIFNTQNEAYLALKEINSNPAYPITCINSRTKQTQENKQKTLLWSEEIIEFLDGKFGFRALPNKVRRHLKIEKHKITEDGKESENGLFDKYFISQKEKSTNIIPEQKLDGTEIKLKKVKIKDLEGVEEIKIKELKVK